MNDTRDLRDPEKLGETLLTLGEKLKCKLSEVQDITDPQTVPYANNEGPVEKYGDARELPEG